MDLPINSFSVGLDKRPLEAPPKVSNGTLRTQASRNLYHLMIRKSRRSLAVLSERVLTSKLPMRLFRSVVYQ